MWKTLVTELVIEELVLTLPQLHLPWPSFAISFAICVNLLPSSLKFGFLVYLSNPEWVLNSLDYCSFLKSLGIWQFRPSSFVILCQIVLATFFYITYTFGPPYPLVPHPGIQPTADWKYLERKIPKHSKKQNLNLPLSQQLFTSHLCCIR